MKLLNLNQSNKKAPRSRFPENVTDIAPNPALPDPFEFFDSDLGTGGRVVTIEDWEARRREIADLAQYYYYGYKQPTPQEASRLGSREVQVPETRIIDRQKVMEPGSFTINLPEGAFSWEFSDFSLRPVPEYRDDEWGSWGDHEELLITIPAHIRTDTFVAVALGDKTGEIKLDALEVPEKGADTQLDGPYPAVIVIGGLPAEQIKTLKENGYAYISMNTGSVYSDDGRNTGAYTTLYPKKPGEYENDSGALMGWAWGVSRIIDGLLNDPSINIDGHKTTVTGVSRNGKAALLAAAFDERVAVAAPCDSGAAGLTGFRFVNEGQLLGYNTFNIHCEVNRVFSRNEKPVNTIGSSHWLSSKARDFLPDKTEHYPFDMHEIAALVAPRPLLAFTGENFEWVNSVSTALTMEAVREVYEFLGAGDNPALIVRDGAHANQDRDLPFLIAVMDREFRRSDTLWVRQFDSLKKPGKIGALDGNGAIYPEKTYPSIAAMNAVPYDIDSSYRRWSRPGKYALWCETELLTEGFDRDIVVHSDAPRVRLTLPDGSLMTGEVSDGTVVFELEAKIAKAGRYKLETVGTDWNNKSIYLQGYTLSDALRHGLNLTSTSPDGMSVGFASRLVNRQVIEARVITSNESKLETGFIDGLSPVYLEAYGVSLKQQHIPEGPFLFNLKNIALDALPGCVFELTMELTGIRQTNMFAGGALEGRARSAQGERPVWNSSCLKNGPIPDWPLYPASEEDRGERPDYIPAETAFNIDITLGEYGGGFAELCFSAPANTNELGIGFDRAISWTTSWAPDCRSLTITYDRDVRGNMRLLLFRLTDRENNMIPGPIVFKLRMD